MKNCQILTTLVFVCSLYIGRAADPLDTWTWRNPVPPPTLSKFAFGGGQFVGVGRYGTVATSVDGMNWVGRSSGTHRDLTGIVFGNGLFAAVTSGDVAVGGAILTSTDG